MVFCFQPEVNSRELENVHLKKKWGVGKRDSEILSFQTDYLELNSLLSDTYG